MKTTLFSLVLILFSCSRLPTRNPAQAFIPSETLYEDYYFYQLLGEIYINEFDQQLTKNEEESPLLSSSYLKLQAIRVAIENIENQVTNLLDLRDWLDKKREYHLRYLFFSDLIQDKKLLRLNSQKSYSKISDELDQHFLSQDYYQYLKLTIEDEASDVASELSQKIFSTPFYRPSVEKQGNLIGSEFPEKVWSLTFDDGPNTTSTKKILENLKRHEIKATFFQLTKNAVTNSSVSKEIKEAGMEIASHSYDHKQLTKVNDKELTKQIGEAVDGLSKLHQVDIEFYRLPYGAGVSSPHIRKKIAEKNLIHVFWSVDTLDWKSGSTAQEVIDRTLKQMNLSKKDSGIILFHDIHERTVKASEEIMKHLKKDERNVCSLKDIVKEMNSGERTCSK